MRPLSRRLFGFSIWLALAATPAAPQTFRFAVIGDRTGETQAGVYEEVWKETAAEKPAFVVATGDTIQGLNDLTAEAEWRAIDEMLKPFRRIPFYPTPGNHDIWSQASERLFREHTRHEPHYSFDYRQAHFTILDNSRSDQLPAEELAFLETDLRAHAAQPVKFIVSHRPSWLIDAVVRNPDFALHQLARKYGAKMVIAGHLHEMLRADLEGVRYISMPSAGGHLRGSKKYADGWFFGYALVMLDGHTVNMQIKELKAPYGQGRVNTPDDWGTAGLLHSAPNAHQTSP